MIVIDKWTRTLNIIPTEVSAVQYPVLQTVGNLMKTQ